MPTTRPTPYLEGKAGDLITAARWNELQVQTREEIAATLAAHEAAAHTGDAQNPQVTALTADSVTAATLTGTTVRATSLTGGTVAADTLSVKNLEVKEGLTLRGTSSGLNAGAPKVWSTSAAANQGSLPFRSGISFSHQTHNQYYGPCFYVGGALSYWIGVPPQLSFRLDTPGLLMLHATWLNYTSGGGNGYAWAQFLIGNGGRFSPVRFYREPSYTYWGDYGYNQLSFTQNNNPTASTFSAWLDTNWNFYNSNSYRWPMAGLVYQNGSTVPHSHQDSIEVPAGEYTINMGYSGYNYVGGLQLRATFFPGGTTQS